MVNDVTSKIADLKVHQMQVAQSQPASRACLMMLSGALLGEVYPLSDQPVLIGRSEQADVRVLVEGVSRAHARLSPDRGDWVIEDLDSRNGTQINGQPIHRAALHDGDKIQIGPSSVFKFAVQDPVEEHFQRQMFESALRDGLTKVFNKRYFVERLRSEVAYALRHGFPLSLLMLDVDLFKRINDRYGHPAGDLALQAIAEAVRRAVRSEDVLSRIGGEEFAVICRGVPLSGALTFAERIRQVVADLAFRDSGTGNQVPLAVSVGVAQLTQPVPVAGDQAVGRAGGQASGPVSGATVASAGSGELAREGPAAEQADLLVAQADRALYAAKDAGRNCVRVAAQPGY